MHLTLGAAIKKLPENLTTPANETGLQLFYLLNQPGKNVVLSPFSISSLLFMILDGSAGPTERNIRSVLELRASMKTIARTYKDYITSLQAPTSFAKTYSYALQNGLWIQRGTPITRTYKQSIKDNFQGKVQSVDFSNPQVAASSINGSISSLTKGKITSLLSPSDISPTTKLFLANTLLFRGDWKYPFPSKNTRKALFHPYGKPDPIMTETLFTEAFLPYYEDTNIQAIALPFNGHKTQPDMEFLVVLPKIGSTNTPFAYVYGGTSFGTIRANMKLERVSVSIPKFSFGVTIPLVNPLETFGITLPFSKRADFSPMSGKKDLFISSMSTQTYISLNEGGLTAAAGSGATFDIKSSAVKNPPKAFEANRPFMYALWDNTSSLLHIIGELDAPTFETFATPNVTLQPQSSSGGSDQEKQGPVKNPLDYENSGQPTEIEGDPSEGHS